MQSYSTIVAVFQVALRKESVDRNRVCAKDITNKKQSLSARRAWIEIKYVVKDSDFSGVALRKESVDRNHLYSSSGVDFSEVALRKESVDRNYLTLYGAVILF